MSENQSLGTPTYSDFVRKLFNRSGDLSKDFTHAVLGISTELHELATATDEVNANEELGDLEFYLEALDQVVGDMLTEPFPAQEITPELEALRDKAQQYGIMFAMLDASNQLQDTAKRWVGYGKVPADPVGVWRLAAAVVVFSRITCAYPNEDVEQIRRINMAKLLKRYPGGEFSAYHALVRDLEAERVVLQTA